MSAVQPLASTTSRPSPSDSTMTVKGPGGVAMVACRARVGMDIRRSSGGRVLGLGGWRAGVGRGRAGEEGGHGERPEVQDGVGPPRAPAGRGVGVGAVEGGERLPQGEVAGEPDVGVGQTAQPDERRRPRPDAGDGEQGPPGLLAVGARVEGDRPVGEGRRQRVHGAAAGAGEPDRGEVGVGEGRGPWEGVGERADRLGQGSAGGRDHPGGQRPGAGHRDLLAEHRPDRQLGGVRRRRDAAAGSGGDERRERRVRSRGRRPRRPGRRRGRASGGSG